MLLIVGLGNPDAKYAANRHNAGFTVLDAIADDYSLGPWKDKFLSKACEGVIQTETGPKKILLIKPQTYYNESGNAVRAAADFYNLTADDIMVFHDEIDLAPGKYRTKHGGGHGGNNGIRSITAHMGNDIHRGRIGVGHPGHKDQVKNYVLSNFTKAENDWFGPLLDAISRSLPLLANKEWDAFQTKVTHLAPTPEGSQSRTQKEQN